MTMTVDEIAARLADEGEKTTGFFRALPAEAWQQVLYTDGEHWSIHQTLVHIVQAEDSVSRLIQGIVKGNDGAPEGFDLDSYNHKKVREMMGLSPDYLLPLFSERRAKTVSMVQQLQDSDLDREGRHPFLGVAPVEEMLKLMYRHTQLHQRDIRKFLKDSG